ncbi:MAG: acyltransferase family protein [Bdellovibrionota bacterium]
MTDRKKFHTLTSLRFFAAYLVLASHVLSMWMRDDLASWPHFFSRIVVGGKIGVAFFFTLSGFVLTYSEHARPAANFWWRRFSKVAPLFYLSLLVHLPAFLLLMNSIVRTVSFARAAKLFAGNLLFLGAWLPDLLVLNSPGWTLSAEIFFYALFPLLLPALTRIPTQRILPALIMNFFFGASFHVLGVLHPSTLPADFFQYNPLVHLNEFIAGILLARLYCAGDGRAAIPSSWLFAFSVVGVVALLEFSDPIPIAAIRSFLGVPFFCLMIWAACGMENTWLTSQPLLSLGDASYALYIMQWPLMIWLELLSFKVAIRGVWLAGIGLLGFPLLSLVLFRYVETPARRWLLSFLGAVL